MTRVEMVRAFQNLGGGGFRQELLEEYCKVHYPSKFYSKEIQRRYLPSVEVDVTTHLAWLRREGFITRQMVKVEPKALSPPVLSHRHKPYYRLIRLYPSPS